MSPKTYTFLDSRQEVTQMLQVTVDQGEYILIGDNIKIYYDRLNSNRQLVLSFDAPREVKVMRQKLHEEKLFEQFGQDSPEGIQLAREIQERKAERERIALFRTERRKERRRAKKEITQKAN